MSGIRKTSLARMLCILLAVMLSVPVSAAETPSVNAVGAIVMDGDTGEVYYARNADKARPIASMTKLMTVYLTFEEIREGRLTLETPVSISQRAAAMSNDGRYSGLEHFRRGQTVPAGTLLRLAICASGNASSVALAEHIAGNEAAFVQRMNERTAAWGVEAQFADSCGFEDEGNAVTPYAMAYLARRLLVDYPETLEYSVQKSVTFQGETHRTTNLLLREGVEGVDGLKTGYTYGAGYCFTATATRNGRRVIAVVMGTNSASARASEAQKLLEYGFAVQAERAEPRTFKGRMNVRRAEIYPDAELTVTCRVACAQDAALIVPCGWYLDGALIEGYQNSVFRLTGDYSRSQITLRGDRFTAGEHVLEFRCNTAGLPGMEPFSVKTELLVLPDADAA
ncbi:MAG: D-alanyl-D-alanine carboxypeptidase [Ruminococcaceae bacterium]|nr:D-alanyl-D-alanine carboxypeptidase [Oscillospiraceae bacterium]